jgi:hypothetical protein
VREGGRAREIEDLVDGGAVPLVHLVELVDAAHAHVRHDQSTAWKEGGGEGGRKGGRGEGGVEVVGM